MKKHLHAFTLIEIMVVIFLIGLMATMIVPRLTRKSPASAWPKVLDEINNAVLFARQEAISNQQLHRLKFKAPHTIVVESEKSDPENPEKKIYAQVTSDYFTTKFDLSEEITINGVYVGKQETMQDNKGEGYCYVISDGLVQDVLVRLTRQEGGQASKVSLRMMPFKGVFQLIEGHVRPGE
ncbi:MAG: prepilin-type N-terminal cleavage/methylation domain-containing protein [bacterium]